MITSQLRKRKLHAGSSLHPHSMIKNLPWGKAGPSLKLGTYTLRNLMLVI
jgi:hypothetical protein